MSKKNLKYLFLSHFPRINQLKIRFLGQKVYSVARPQTDRLTDMKVNTEDTLSRFQEFVLSPTIKDRSNNINNIYMHLFSGVWWRETISEPPKPAV